MFPPPLLTPLFNLTVTVSRPTTVTDGQGGWPDETVTVGEVPGRIRSWTSEEQLTARQSGVRISHVFYCAGDVDIRRGDTVEVPSMPRPFDVRSVRRPSFPDHHLMVDLEERQT
jgi:SPP1 family predicted phage head-tail adaptor